ncbi:MAG TPA: hypothetical protein DC049_08750, partial [Spirochaetia bacterium]|nr:hypothetical protein [Spirochaetia bacterium]
LPQSGSHYVGIDERKTIQLLMDHLTEQNCRNIVFFTFISEGFVLERVRELVADLRARDLQVNQQWIYGYSCAKDRLDSGICAQSAKRVNRKTGLSLHSHIQAYIRRMRYFGFPDAVIFSTDRQAVLFMQAAAAAGIRIPEDVAVAGIDDSQIAYDVSEQELCARLTTIRQNFREIGRSAVRLLNVVCRNPDSSREMLIDPLLIVRASTLKQSSGCFVPADINFRSEITAWLEDHYADEHILQQLTERFELNKAYFLIKCKKLFGVNFIRLLNDVRIRKSLYYLGHTDQNITEIYTAAGYNSYQNFNREFKKRLGKPPYRYKKLSGVRRIAY